MVIKGQYIKAYFDEKMAHPQRMGVRQQEPFFVNGQEYILQGTQCDDFTMPTRKYKLVGVVNEFEGISIESVIMKQIEGPQSSMIFTLTKNDCKKLGIEFEQGLQLYPKSLAWVKNEKKETLAIESKSNKYFDENDLSTYPLDYDTKKIKNIAIKVSGFLPRCTDLRNLRITLKGNSNVDVPFKIITNAINSNYKLVDGNGDVFIECCLSGYHGINPQELKNRSINDIIEVKLV